ncbi:phage tail assembly protein [Limnobaculum zhutongyuii]|uniref:Phage tail assembly protein n=1 Tax=Limnobaculum zhutongyuii TaxID=2498113 RepID=A0A411WQJ9_9GAMM|nr:phage tail assembly protein [Limnobaculum zhutongyuii]QBH98410.1 phage tail assembly protein [Limnobaculum zhutongyuii]TQS89692.1 phage tail assembly protein [Limnobaculum zhutongyuii]
MITVPLSKPIKAHGEELNELNLKAPSVPDIRKNGIPLIFQTDGAMSINANAVLNYLPALAGIPPSAVDQLDPPDITAICMAVIPFFTGSGT